MHRWLVYPRNVALRMLGVAGELRAAREEEIRRLAVVVEYRDTDTGGHIERMADYAALIAEQLEIAPSFVADLRLAAVLHDVGKVAVPDAILLKPGPLTAAERSVMERHAAEGHAMLAGSGNALLELAAAIALTHHERFDGTGYPRGITGDAIPLAGRIVAVADVFDALTSDRVYRPALPATDAVAVVVAGAGTQFDPAVVNAFCRAVPSIALPARREPTLLHLQRSAA
jgi:putative two-component system response regulator